MIAAGIDNLSGKFLKDGADILAMPISQLCNPSIKLNLLPRSCKIKKAPKMILKTFAPFHCSPSYKKLLKGLFMTKHKNFWIKNKILYRFQSGFRKNYSTNTCLEHLTDKITTRFEKGIFTWMILIGLQKVVGTIDHQILIKNEMSRFSKRCNCLV